jgi:amino acid adenylation domain-containing protein
MEERGDEWVASAEYRSDLFTAESIGRLLEQYERVLESMVREPQRPIGEVSLLSEAERREIVETWNQTEGQSPVNRCVHEVFDEQAARTGESEALVYRDEVLTYRQVQVRANQLSHYLRKQGLGPDRIVGVYLERGPDLIIALLATLKAGGCYVPLDCGDPQERLSWMLEDTGLEVVITQQSLAGALAGQVSRVICLDRERVQIEQESTEGRPCSIGAEDRAYVMYTSGSTGRPKGVEISHRGIVRLVCGVDYVDLGGRQSFLQLAPVSFDASTFEIWGALLQGHRCVLYPDEVPDLEKLGEVLSRERIDCLWLTASMFNMVIEERPQILKGVRQLLTGGEALSVPHVRRALEQLPQTQLINGYGPTESTTFTCSYRIPRRVDERARSIPIGRPINHTQVYILDGRMRVVPVGVAGQLYVGGAGLARGYWRRPELTSERFVVNPFDPTGKTRLYKTGDLCRYLSDGSIEFLGRQDDQVKIRGYRIEPGEIEAVLSDQGSVSQAAVVVRQDRPGEKRLVGYVVMRPGQGASGSELREYLGQRLPEYMVPSAIVMMDSLPLTVSGKVDRRALPAPSPDQREGRPEYAAPQTPVQEALCRIFAEVLGVEKVGIHDNFFELGGHSLLAVRLLQRVELQFHRSLPLATLFKARTVAEICELVADKQAEVAYSPLVQLRSGGTGSPLFILPGAGGHAMAFSALAGRLDLDGPVYALELQGLDGKIQPHKTIEETAAHFIELVQGVQRQGPYSLAGYSFGGRVAFEMALQLTQKGQRVAKLVMIAATAPGCPRTSQYAVIRGLLRMSDFLQMPHREKLEYLRFKVWKTRDKSRQRRARRASAAGTKSSLDASIKAVTKSAHKAWRIYNPKARYSGDLLVIRDTNVDSPLYRAIVGLQAGWERHVTGTIHVHEVPSGHLEILKEPYVDILARGISDYLRKQQDDRARSSPLEPAHAGSVEESSATDLDRSACTGWPAAPDLPSPPEGELHVFVADLDMPPNLLGYYGAFLSPEERDRATRFVQVRDRDRYVARHGLLRELLSRYTSLSPERVEIHCSEAGKPSLRNRQNPWNLRFSVSSREGLALYAFTCKDDIGIDLERTRPIANLLDMAALQMPTGEVECLRDLAEPLRLEMFYTIWTCKEAYIKARGIVPLKQFTLSLAPGGTPEVSADEIDPRQVGQWSFSLLAVGPDWHAALAVRKGDHTLRCWKVER